MALRAFSSEAFRMRATKQLVAMLALGAVLLPPATLPAQDKKEVNLAAAPPKIALLEHVQIFSGKTEERRKLEENFSTACDRLDAPRFWIDLESLTGDTDSLVFSSFDSYEQLEGSSVDWNQFLSAHSDLQRIKDEARGLATAPRRIIAVRRDDLGYLADTIDLSEARYLAVMEVRLFPGHERDFADAVKIIADAHLKVQAELPWVVYEVDAGLPAPAFLVLQPMSELKQRDDLLALSGSIADAEGDPGVESLKKIARESYALTEHTVYSISPGMSHVSKAFAATDLEYWSHHSSEAKPEAKPDAKPDSKPKPKAAQKPAA
jgi:hypothetical protein